MTEKEISVAVGDRVKKCTGDYSVTGWIVAAFRKRSGAVRYVVECEQPAGLLLIYNQSQLEPVELVEK